MRKSLRLGLILAVLLIALGLIVVVSRSLPIVYQASYRPGEELPLPGIDPSLAIKSLADELGAASPDDLRLSIGLPRANREGPVSSDSFDRIPAALMGGDELRRIRISSHLSELQVTTLSTGENLMHGVLGGMLERPGEEDEEVNIGVAAIASKREAHFTLALHSTGVGVAFGNLESTPEMINVVTGGRLP